MLALRKYPSLLLLFLLLCMDGTFKAQPIRPRYLTIEQGLSNNSVRCIFQDHNGFMWFGTYDGLNRFDGYEFRVFRNNLNDSSSLPHNYIYSIGKDRSNRLWVGTGQGASTYNNVSGSFSPTYYRRFDDKRRQKISINVTAIQGDDSGHVFIGTNGQGLLMQKNATETAVQIPCKANGITQYDYSVPAMNIDSQGRCWIFIDQLGLCEYVYKNASVELVSNSTKTASSIAVDNNGGIWIGTGNGLFLIDLVTGKTIRSYRESAGSLNSNAIASLYLDPQNRLWIGTEGGGINILNIPENSFNYLQPGQNRQGLSSESVFSIYGDKNGRKWIGTLKGGIDIIDPEKPNFQTIAHEPLNANSLVNNFASCFFEDSARNMWVGTDGGGMSIWNRSTNNFSNYSYEAGKANSLSNNLVTSIRQDSYGNTWVATFRAGINKFNRATGRFTHYQCINPQTGRENKSAWLLYEDHDKTLWATTFGEGALYRYNRVTDKFDAFAPGASDLISFVEDDNGRIWAGNASQLFQINKTSGKFTAYEIGKPVRAICEDTHHNFWLGTEGGGLILFDRQSGKIKARYSAVDGLCNNSVLNILEDDNGFLWLSTFNGLSRFHAAKKSFKNFYQSDGLQSNQFLYGAALRLRSGELVFGGIKGFSIFQPDSLFFEDREQPLRITNLSIDNQLLHADDNFVTSLNGDMVSALKIPYDKGLLSLEFAALEYLAPSKIQYAYFLEGWDKKWNYSGNTRFANYSRLKEGTYYFKVKATNILGDWNPGQTLMKITVSPPWYRSWWAYLIYAAIFSSLILLYNRYRVRQSQLEYEVRLASLNAEKEKELNEKKMSFFTDISHEFRTPLTLIINPLKDLVQDGRKILPQELQMVQRNANRLLRLVDQLLHFQKAGSGAEQMQVTPVELERVCREMVDNFSAQAQRKNLDLSFISVNKSLQVFADREKLEIILINLLSNAIKYTPENGRVSLELREQNDTVEIVVTDSGPGIPQGIGDRIFERFYQVKGSRSTSKPGFGIGLYLVKQYVELHKGTIRYESEPGKGTVFQLEFLKGSAHFDASVLRTAIASVNEILPDNSPVTTQPSAEELLPIPRSTEPSVEKAQTGIDSPEPISAKSLILVIEDNDDIREYVLGIFGKNYQLLQAADGNAGLLLARQYLPDLIISDIMMPGTSGIELCRTIKSDAALGHIPVILLTAATDSEVKLLGVKTGADDYITKPFDKDLLLARVVNLLKKRTTLQDYFYNEITHRQNDARVSPEYRDFLQHCISIVEAHLGDENFSIGILAKELGMSHSNLYKKIKSISGQSANAFIRFIRLRKAAELLIKSERNVNEAAFEVGINDIKYFREQFNKVFGMNPSEYIKKFRSGFNRPYRINKDAFGGKQEP